MPAQPDGAAPAIISDHEFVPRDEAQPWGLCKTCGLSEPAHLKTSVQSLTWITTNVKSK
jgi:hypothetical protein